MQDRHFLREMTFTKMGLLRKIRIIVNLSLNLISTLSQLKSAGLKKERKLYKFK